MNTTVLLIDPRSGQLARELDKAGFTVCHVDTGPAALALICEAPETIDAIVLEVLLPGLSGYRVLQRLRADGITVPIVLCSAKDGEYDQADGLDLGADAYLVKPVSVLVLAAYLRALLRRHLGMRLSDEPVRVGLLTMDPVQHTITIAGRSARLTPREYTLLHALALHPSAILSRDELMRLVWGETTSITRNTVEVYIAYLRRHLRTLHAGHMLRTARCAGYQLDPHAALANPPPGPSTSP